jgi:hypothetical protein
MQVGSDHRRILLGGWEDFSMDHGSVKWLGTRAGLFASR